jgi:PiT family inorganic phosphate transporter
VAGGIVSAGLGKRLAEVRWGTVGRIVIAWVLTLPVAAAAGALSGRVADMGTTGTVVVAVVGIAIGAGVYLLARRSPGLCFLAAAGLIGYGLYLVAFA